MNALPIQAFCVGFCAKFLATIVTYPIIRAKVLLMIERDDSSRTHGIVGMFQVSAESSTLRIFET
jgi:hypothetical protein